MNLYFLKLTIISRIYLILYKKGNLFKKNLNQKKFKSKNLAFIHFFFKDKNCLN
jgi:hypothetical protein